MKRCTKCSEMKSLDAFGKHSSTKDGLRHVCRECNNASARKWGYENPEKALALARKWIANNPARRKEILRKNYEIHGTRYHAEALKKDRAHPEIRNQRNRDRYRANLDHARALARKFEHTPRRRAYMYAYWNKRRAMKMNATPEWLTAIHLAQMQEFYDIAIARTTQTGIPYHVDHIHPLKGRNFRGLHVPWNLQVLTASENISKGHRLIDETLGVP